MTREATVRIPELTEGVGPPAIRVSPLRPPARVDPPCLQLGELEAALDREGRRAGSRGPVPKLAIRVVPPAVRVSRRRQPARVAITGAHRGENERSRHSHGLPRGSG